MGSIGEGVETTNLGVQLAMGTLCINPLYSVTTSVCIVLIYNIVQTGMAGPVLVDGDGRLETETNVVGLRLSMELEYK